MAAIFEQLKIMYLKMQDLFVVEILAASIKITGLRPDTKTIKFLAEDDLKRNTISEKFTYEVQGLKKGKTEKLVLLGSKITEFVYFGIGNPH